MSPSGTEGGCHVSQRSVGGWRKTAYLRNGPNPAVAPDPQNYHWFMGDGMVHGIRLRGGKAEWDRNRWVRSERLALQWGEEPPRASSMP